MENGNRLLRMPERTVQILFSFQQLFFPAVSAFHTDCSGSDYLQRSDHTAVRVYLWKDVFPIRPSCLSVYLLSHPVHFGSCGFPFQHHRSVSVFLPEQADEPAFWL